MKQKKIANEIAFPETFCPAQHNSRMNCHLGYLHTKNLKENSVILLKNSTMHL